MNQRPAFSYAPLTTTAALCTSSAISGVMSTIFAFKVLLHYPNFFELINYSYLGALGAAAVLPLMTASVQKCIEQDEKVKLPFEVSKGWFSLAIAASTTAIANSIYYSATHDIANNMAIGISALSGMVITACAMRMCMDRIRDNSALSLA